MFRSVESRCAVSRRHFLGLGASALGLHAVSSPPFPLQGVRERALVVVRFPGDGASLHELRRHPRSAAFLSRLQRDDSLAVLRGVDARASSLADLGRGTRNGFVSRPGQPLAGRLRDIAALIRAGVRTSLFDTGPGAFRDGDDVAQLDRALRDFVAELRRTGVWREMAIIVVPEAKGTALLAGGRVRGGEFAAPAGRFVPVLDVHDLALC